MFSLLQHFTLPANWHELVYSNMHPGIYNTYICVLLWGIWKPTGKSSFCFKDFHVSNLAIMHGTFARETLVGSRRVSKSDAAKAKLAFVVVLCLYVSMVIGL